MAKAQPTESSSAQAATTVAPGFSIDDLPRRLGRYTLLRRIAKGGMGEVLLGATMGLEGAERPVIIKMIRSEHRTDASFKARFLDEARVQAQLQHSGIAQVIEATSDEASGEPYVAVEYVEGRSLGDLRQRGLTHNQRLAWHEVVSIGALAAEALGHMHDRRDPTGKPLGIVHRDLSPQNIMLSYTGELKVIDFGTARGQNRKCHTVAGVVFAKPGYVAPEVANGDPGDYRVDLYALGVMLWELLRGTRFLQGDSADHMAAVAKGERELPLVAEDCGAPAALDTILAKLTVFDRDRRYTDTRLAARDLAALLASAPPLPSGERGIRARTASVMDRLFQGESMKVRREFMKLVAHARTSAAGQPTPPSAVPISMARAAAEEASGMLPGTRYKLGAKIGEGDGGVVHEALHVDLGRKVAIKIGRADASGREAGLSRIRREARALGLVKSPGVVRLIDVGRASDDRPFAVMELCTGETLEKRTSRLARQGGERDAVTDALDLVDRALSVLADVHAAGVVHRDIKPSNIFVETHGGVRLLDFGIALMPKGEGDAEPSKTNGVEIFGTPDYMAPEQAARGKADERSDIYAMGSVLYELLTGKLPFHGRGVALLLEAKAQGNPPTLREAAPERNIPSRVDELCMRALARHPSLRFQSANEMRDAITAALREPARRRSRRRWAALGAFVTAVAAGGVYLLTSGRALLSRTEDKVGDLFSSTPEVVEMANPVADEPATGADLAAVEAPRDAESAANATAPAVDHMATEVASDGLATDPTDGEDVSPATEPAPATVPAKDEKRAAVRQPPRKPHHTADAGDKKTHGSASKKHKKKR
ncbi:MAG: protein kinase [Polyangiaceae bacterium]